MVESKVGKMSRNIKGRNIRTLIKKILLARGYSIYLAPHTKYLPNDVFGADLIAMKKDEIIFVQTTADTNIKRKADELQKYPYPHYIKRQIWRHIGGRRRKLRENKWSKNQYIYIYNEKGEKIDEIDLYDYKDVLRR